MQQEFPHGGIFGQADRPIVGVLGFGSFPQKFEKMSANGPIGLISGDRFLIDSVENGQSPLGFVGLGEGGGVCRAHADGRRYEVQLFIEIGDRFPLNPAAACALGMDRLNRRIELKTSWAAKF